MKCKECEFWSKCEDCLDYGECSEPEQVRMDKELEESELYSHASGDLRRHKNDCCSLHVTVKITKEKL